MNKFNFVIVTYKKCLDNLILFIYNCVMSPWHDKNLLLNDRKKGVAYWFGLVLFSAFSCISILLFYPKNSVLSWVETGLGFLIAVLLAIFIFDKLILQYVLKSIPAYSLWEKVSLVAANLLGGIYRVHKVYILTRF
jgi:hypothetical protein